MLTGCRPLCAGRAVHCARMSKGGPDVQEQQLPHRYASLTKALCILIVALMVAGMLYAGWISVMYYGQIGV